MACGGCIYRGVKSMCPGAGVCLRAKKATEKEGKMNDLDATIAELEAQFVMAKVSYKQTALAYSAAKQQLEGLDALLNNLRREREIREEA